MTECALLEVQNLTKRYGSFTAVDNLSMTVKKGEFMGLLGPNGAGKSTTLKSITGLVRPTEGTILVNGVDAMKHKEAMTRVGCVIQTSPLPRCSSMSVRSMVFPERRSGSVEGMFWRRSGCGSGVTSLSDNSRRV